MTDKQMTDFIMWCNLNGAYPENRIRAMEYLKQFVQPKPPIVITTPSTEAETILKDVASRTYLPTRLRKKIRHYLIRSPK